MLVKAKLRGQDAFGSGAYGSPREGGKRKHNGIDFLSNPGDELCSHIQGKVTKLGYPYADTKEFRYVEITNSVGFAHRFFYVEPSVKVGEEILIGEKIGVSQNLGTRYKGIPNHFHYEVCKYVNGKKEFYDPNEFIK